MNIEVMIAVKMRNHNLYFIAGTISDRFMGWRESIHSYLSVGNGPHSNTMT